jgi:hypothetical protein
MSPPVAAFWDESFRAWCPIDETTARRLDALGFEIAPIQWAMKQNRKIAKKERRKPHAKK